MFLPIITWPAKVLETKASLVEVFDDELKQFVENMFDTMKDSKGIGLAANQVGSLRRVIVIDIPHNNHSHSHTFINPEIIKKEGSFKFKEACLSFPQIFESIDRSEKVTVRAQNIFGEFFELEAEGLFAVCIQHEIDHLDGIVFTKRMSRLKADIVNRKMLKR
jgi:peptide deformylase